MAEISKPVKRVDFEEKVTGAAKFVADVDIPGMLTGKLFLSTRPRARIENVIFPEIPEGYYIFSHRDIPGSNRLEIVIDDMPFLAEDEVNYFGQPVFLVVGEDPQKVEEIRNSIKVEYRDIPPILSIEDAESGRFPPVYGDNNVFADYSFSKGDPDRAFSEADEIVEEVYRTGYQEHVYLETQGVVATFEDGILTVFGSMQCPFYVKDAVLRITGLTEEKVRVIQSPTGGGFGGKEDFPSLIGGLAALATLKTGKPVKILLNREEDIVATTKRHPSILKYRTAIKNGRIIAIDIDVKLDGGAYATLSAIVLMRAVIAATGIYRFPNLRVRGRAFATNKPPSSAFRGFGAPQVFFGIEMHMNSLSEKLGYNPMEFKKLYALRKGDTTSTGGTMRSEVKVPEIIDLIDRMSNFREKYTHYRRRKKFDLNEITDKPLKGIGFSIFFRGCALTGKGEDKVKATAGLKKYPDGRVEILVANTEIGQGARTALTKIVSSILNIPPEKVIYNYPDTSRVPDSGPTVASRTTMVVGKLLEKAARKMLDMWDRKQEFAVFETYTRPEGLNWDEKNFKGDPYLDYSWGANVAEVEIDPLTFEVRVKKIWAVYDIGVPIDERMMRGQIEGGIAQGLGYATLEVLEFKNGVPMQKSLTDYIIPTSLDVPEIESRVIENPSRLGPYGAKCAGEVPFVGVAPAIAAAISLAIGKNINKIPATPEYILEVLSED